MCHAGFVVGSQPYVIPTLYARIGAEILFHGSAASRMLRAIGEGVRVCITVDAGGRPRFSPAPHSIIP